MSELLDHGNNIPITDRPFAVYVNSFPILRGARDASILDIGCGASTVGQDLARNGNFYVGLDDDPAAVSRDLLAHGDELPFKDKSFDIVMAFYSLPHWARNGEQVQRFVRECGRVARQSILISPDEPSENLVGGHNNMLAVDVAFQSAVSELTGTGWKKLPTKFRITQLYHK